MKRALIILLLACCPLSYGQTVQDYSGQSAAQLSAMTDYVTIPNTSYWNTHAYLQLRTLFNWVAPVDYVTDIYGSADSMYYSLGDTNDYPKIKGMIDINGPRFIFIPPSVTLAANRNYAHNGTVKSLIDISATHDVVVTGGGTLYGKADSCLFNDGQTEYDCGIEIKSSQRVLVDGLNIRYPSGDGVGVGYVQWPTYNEADTSYYRVESNGVTIRNTTVYAPTIKHWNHPVNEQIGRNAIAVTGAKNVIIDGCYLYGGIPAVIDVEGNTSHADTVDNLIITNCVIDGLSKGRYTIGAVINDSSFYLKSTRGIDLNIPADSLAGLRFLSDNYGIVASKYGGSVNDWQSISSNTATSGGSTVITVANAWATAPTTSHYVVLYNTALAWPTLPDTTMLYGDAKVTTSGTYTVTVTGITVTANALAGYSLYLTTYPMGRMGTRHIETNLINAGDSVLVTLNRSIFGLTPVRGQTVGLGDSWGSGISVGGSPLYRNIIIANNIIRNTFSYGIRLQQGGTDTTHKIIVSGNRFENCWGSVGVEVAGTRNIKISDNHIFNCNLGINVLGPENQTVEGNTIVNCPTGGIWVLGSPGNDSTGTITRTVITGNNILECGARGATYPEESIWMSWTKNSICDGNAIVNTDTSTSAYQRAIHFNYCKNLYIGDNPVVGYNGRYWWHDGSTFKNTIFSYDRRNVGINVPTTAHALAIADSVGGTNYTAIDGGTIYPNAVSPANKINVNGSTLLLHGGTTVALTVPDTSGTDRNVLTVSIDGTTDQHSIGANAPVLFKSYTDAEETAFGARTAGTMFYNTTDSQLKLRLGTAWRTISTNWVGIQANTYDAATGDMWVNTSHDTLWYSADGTNAAFILIDGYAAKH